MAFTGHLPATVVCGRITSLPRGLVRVLEIAARNGAVRLGSLATEDFGGNDPRPAVDFVLLGVDGVKGDGGVHLDARRCAEGLERLRERLLVEGGAVALGTRERSTPYRLSVGVGDRERPVSVRPSLVMVPPNVASGVRACQLSGAGTRGATEGFRAHGCEASASESVANREMHATDHPVTTLPVATSAAPARHLRFVRVHLKALSPHGDADLPR